MPYPSRPIITGLCLGLLASVSAAEQAPDRAPAPAAASSIVARMMAFDKNGDGRLTRDEITDGRLLRLFERADANRDGVVTREELTAVAAQLAAEQPATGGPNGRFGGPGGFGPGGPGGPDGFGPGGPGRLGPGGGLAGFGPPQPGQILSPFLQERLQLTADQRKQLAALQREVDARLEKLLTSDQKRQLVELRQRGTGRFGSPGGPPDFPGGFPPAGP